MNAGALRSRRFGCPEAAAVLDRVADGAEDLADLAAQEDQGDDGDEGEDQRIGTTTAGTYERRGLAVPAFRLP